MVACPRCHYENASKAIVCAVCSERLAPTVSDSDLSRRPRNLVGRVVNGKYEIIDLLGEGGMGVVYKVRHLLLQHRNLFALKILHPRFSADKRFQKRFLREVELTMELTHENVIQIRDFGMTEDGHLFFTMDFFPGRSLKSLLASDGPLRPARAVAITREIAIALREAHRAGIIHRDLKPDNVLVETDSGKGERVRVLDFGIAKLLEGDAGDNTLTDGTVVGTPKYMSPEQAAGEPLDARSDLYSLGVVIYEMLSGRTPFSGETTRAVLMGHLTATPVAFSALSNAPNVPCELERLVFDLLAKEPDDRPASADEVLVRLAADPTVVRSAVPRRRRSTPYVWVVALAAASFLVAVGAEWLVPWVARAPQAEAESERDRDPAASARGAGHDGESSERSAPARAGGARAPERNEAAPRFRCEVCGGEYRRGEKVGNMCHGLPLLESRGR